ncbi:MAG: sigma-70 family RNA polymerase sigma factor [Eubacteriales bacterium]|nr:sigma-70 family RNA polymerase sigma factor [Eubacteriales bacterium]
MDDSQIVELYWQRSEQAISETEEKYGGYCYSVAYNVLSSREDAQECVNDTYLAAWDNLPPHRPACLGSFLGKLTRRISISRWRRSSSQKRGGGQVLLALEELDGCVADPRDVEGTFQLKQTVRCLNRFLAALPKTERDVFLRRYFLLDGVKDIAESFGFTESKVKSMLLRTRTRLRTALEKEELQ